MIEREKKFQPKGLQGVSKVDFQWLANEKCDLSSTLKRNVPGTIANALDLSCENFFAKINGSIYKETKESRILFFGYDKNVYNRIINSSENKVLEKSADFYVLINWIDNVFYPFLKGITIQLENGFLLKDAQLQINQINDVFFKTAIVFTSHISSDKKFYLTGFEYTHRLALIQEVFLPLQEYVDDIIIKSNSKISLKNVIRTLEKETYKQVLGLSDNILDGTMIGQNFVCQQYEIDIVRVETAQLTTTPTPAVTTLVAPTPVATTPIAPTPIAPTPIAPTPVVPTPVVPTPVVPIDNDKEITKQDYTIYIVGAGALAILALLFTKKNKE